MRHLPATWPVMYSVFYKRSLGEKKSRDGSFYFSRTLPNNGVWGTQWQIYLYLAGVMGFYTSWARLGESLRDQARRLTENVNWQLPRLPPIAISWAPHTASSKISLLNNYLIPLLPRTTNQDHSESNKKIPLRVKLLQSNKIKLLIHRCIYLSDNCKPLQGTSEASLSLSPRNLKSNWEEKHTPIVI